MSITKDQVVVTYRAFVAGMMAVIVGLIAFIGRDLKDGQSALLATMNKVQISVGVNTHDIADHARRLDRAEVGIEQLNDRDNGLDHRVTVIETRQGAR